MKMKGLCLTVVLSIFALPIMAQASLVTVNDGEEFDFDKSSILMLRTPTSLRGLSLRVTP